MTDEGATALVPSEVRAVDFYGDEITGALVGAGDEATIYVPVRPICDYLGLSWGSQRNRLYRDEVLREGVRGVFITNTPQAGGRQEMLCLPIDLLPGFLFGITASRVRPDLQDKIVRYRRECFRVLWAAFKHAILPPAELAPAPAQSGAALAYELATAVQNLAREQMEVERRMDHAARWAKTVDERLTTLELQVNPQQPISEAQATELALAVKTVAQALEQRGASNGYQRVYGELYRRYSIGSYRNLPRSRFDQALEWLRAWYDEILAQDAGSDTQQPG